jgi:hypothetical protein
VPGIAYLDDACGVRRTSTRPFIKSLDELPLPAWDLVDIDRYREIWQHSHGYYSMNIATTRGCPYHCNWCAKPIYGQRYATRSAEGGRRRDRLAQAASQPDHLWIVDDVFGLKPGWVEEFAALVNERGARVPYRCLMRADQVTPAVARRSRDRAVRCCGWGRSPDRRRFLTRWRRVCAVEDIRGANRFSRPKGIDVGVFLQFGYPGETVDRSSRRRCNWRASSSRRSRRVGIVPAAGDGILRSRAPGARRQVQNWFDSSDLATMYQAT